MTSRETKIAELAAEMGVTVGDLTGFAACLSLWVAKGYTLEQAIAKHMDQMNRFANNGAEWFSLLKPMAVEWFREANV